MGIDANLSHIYLDIEVIGWDHNIRIDIEGERDQKHAAQHYKS